jgi:ribosomal-protein-alanine N-acetyltransferase
MLYLESERTIIRNLKEEDLDPFVLYRSDPSVVKYQGYEVFNKKSAFEFILSQKEAGLHLIGNWMQFAIIEKASNQLIGDCAVRLRDGKMKSAEIGCTISPLRQKCGYANEALGTLSDYLFRKSGIKRIHAVVDAENRASVNLMERLNFKKEGEEIVKFKGQWCKEFKFVLEGNL